MNPPVDALQALLGGIGAVLTPGTALSTLVVAAAGASLGARLPWSRHAIAATALLGLVVVATLRRGVGAEGLFSVAVGLAAFAALFLVLRAQDAAPWRAALAGLLAGIAAVLWRVEAFGPVLAELRGPWQSAPSTGLLAAYHLGTAMVWAVVYLAAAGVGRLVGARAGWFAWLPWGAVGVAAGLVLATGQWMALVSFLLLKWPHVPLG